MLKGSDHGFSPRAGTIQPPPGRNRADGQSPYAYKLPLSSVWNKSTKLMYCTQSVSGCFAVAVHCSIGVYVLFFNLLHNCVLLIFLLGRCIKYTVQKNYSNQTKSQRVSNSEHYTRTLNGSFFPKVSCYTSSIAHSESALPSTGKMCNLEIQ